MDTAPVLELPVGRAMFVDEQGLALRATWHLDRGFVNLSVWRDSRCSETFRLTVEDTGRFVGFLVDGLSEATIGLLRRVSEGEPSPALDAGQRSGGVSGAIRSWRTRIAARIVP